MKKTSYTSNKSFMYNCPYMKPIYTFNSDKHKIFTSKISHKDMEVKNDTK